MSSQTPINPNNSPITSTEEVSSVTPKNTSSPPENIIPNLNKRMNISANLSSNGNTTTTSRSDTSDKEARRAALEAKLKARYADF